MIDCAMVSDRPAAIGLGSNLGDSQQFLNMAVAQLSAHPRIRVQRVASFYITKPIGPPQPDYLNSAVTLTTDLDPWALLDVLQAIEYLAGRERKEHWGARTLDLDLLLYGAWIIDTPRLQVPHPWMGDRAFVLVPLAEIAGDWSFGGSSVREWRSTVDFEGQKSDFLG
jgi:2-amino-4-hydroxy-6-hydroxymethyldihydropteridine diphosphokinase